MAPKDIYQDDGALSKFLDGLIDSAHEDNNRDVRGTREFSPITLNMSFAPEQLHEGIPLANDMLREGGQCAPLPNLTENNENAVDVLAAAVSAIVRLSRCCKANANLRVEAERRTQATQAEVDRLSRTLQVTKDKIERKESALMGVRNKLAEVETKNKRRIRQLSTENNSIKARLAGAEGQVNQLNLEAKKRERQYTQLQQRVHALMSASKKLSIEPVITKGEGNKLKFGRMRGTEKECMDDKSADNPELETDLASVILAENSTFRRLLHSIQLELDDLISRYRSAFHFLYPPAEQPGDTSDLSDGEDETNSRVPPLAPSLERMHLPYEMIKEDVEGLIDEKLSAIRTALAEVQ